MNQLVMRGVAVLIGCAAVATAQPPQPGKGPERKPGVSVNDPKALRGYTLVASLNSTKAFLVDMDGRVVKTWETGVTPGASTYLLDNGNLLRTGNLGAKNKINGAGVGGRVLELNWDGEAVWDFTYVSDKSQQHHDVCRMPNGNLLMIVWDKKTKDEAIAAGRRPDSIRGDSLLADAIIEVKPTGKTSGEIVWEWRCWDHLVQDFDKTKANYGNVQAKPELVDINFGSGALAAMMTKKDDLEKLRDLGYVGGPPKTPPPPPGGQTAPPKDAQPAPAPPAGGPTPDWTHFNAVAYNADLDQIMISVHAFSEIWVIDHGTTTKEAAGHTGGKQGKGGDLLYRWGNPRAYRSGTNADQKLFQQHNAHWIPKGHPGEGNVIIFNNGPNRRDGNWSSVDEIVLPADAGGKYARKAGLPFGPDKPVWSYNAEKKTDFFASFISGAHRLPNGNTFICSGPDGTVFEVTPDKQTVWKFVNPAAPASTTAVPPALPLGQVLPPPAQDQLKFTPEQKKQLEEFQKEIDARLDKMMTEEQRKQFKAMREPPAPPRRGGPGPGGLFRSYRFAADHPGLAGKDLKPGKKLEEIVLEKK
jgi:hypothetical protein